MEPFSMPSKAIPCCGIVAPKGYVQKKFYDNGTSPWPSSCLRVAFKIYSKTGSMIMRPFHALQNDPMLPPQAISRRFCDHGTSRCPSNSFCVDSKIHSQEGSMIMKPLKAFQDYLRCFQKLHPRRFHDHGTSPWLPKYFREDSKIYSEESSKIMDPLTMTSKRFRVASKIYPKESSISKITPSSPKSCIREGSMIIEPYHNLQNAHVDSKIYSKECSMIMELSALPNYPTLLPKSTYKTVPWSWNLAMTSKMLPWRLQIYPKESFNFNVIKPFHALPNDPKLPQNLHPIGFHDHGTSPWLPTCFHVPSKIDSKESFMIMESLHIL